MKNEPVAVITGASRGMGRACAHVLAARGYRLALMSPSGCKEVATKLNGIGIAGRVEQLEDLQKLVNDTMDTYGRIDAVINSTGHPAQGDLLSLTDKQWHDGLNLVFLNVVRMARLITRIMLKQGNGAFVNISTFAAFEPNADFPISAPLRAALAGYTKLYSDQYANKNIRMNNILPGFIENYEIDESTRTKIPMQRSGKVIEIAKTATFLLSSDAGYITGQNIRVDGGLTRSV